MADSTGPASAVRSGSGNTLEAPPIQVPSPGELSGQQVRGRACVWCAVALSNATAYDLGVREADAHASAARWFPRACRSCAITKAYGALLDHSQSCEQCNHDPARCADGSALRRAVREARR